MINIIYPNNAECRCQSSPNICVSNHSKRRQCTPGYESYHQVKSAMCRRYSNVFLYPQMCNTSPFGSSQKSFSVPCLVYFTQRTVECVQPITILSKNAITHNQYHYSLCSEAFTQVHIQVTNHPYSKFQGELLNAIRICYIELSNNTCKEMEGYNKLGLTLQFVVSQFGHSLSEKNKI